MAVIEKSFAHIYFRNTFNERLPTTAHPTAANTVEKGIPSPLIYIAYLYPFNGWLQANHG